MLYEELKVVTKSLGFVSIEDFAKYVGMTPSDVLKWEEDEVPYTISLIVHLLKGEKLPNSSALDILVEECLPLASLLEEASSFPHKLEEMFLLQRVE